jgi:hypothetical protein
MTAIGRRIFLFGGHTTADEEEDVDEVTAMDQNNHIYILDTGMSLERLYIVISD